MIKIEKPPWKKQQKKKQRLKSKADKLWGIAIIKKWGGICYCNTKASLPHHFYPKGLYGHLRYDLDNGIPLCFGHHFAHHSRGDPQVHWNIIDTRGKPWFNRLKKKALTRPKASFQTQKFYEEIIIKLEE